MKGGLRGKGEFHQGKALYVGRGKSFKKTAGQPGRQQQTSSAAASATQQAVSTCPPLLFQLGRLQNSVANFKAGKISKCIQNWQKITTDRELLAQVQGVEIDFEHPCSQYAVHKPLVFDTHEKMLMQAQIDKTLEKGEIEESRHETGEFVSNIFSRPKKDGTVRVILNLKNLNKKVEYHHFKMETLNHAIQLMTKDCYMA